MSCCTGCSDVPLLESCTWRLQRPVALVDELPDGELSKCANLWLSPSLKLAVKQFGMPAGLCVKTVGQPA